MPRETRTVEIQKKPRKSLPALQWLSPEAKNKLSQDRTDIEEDISFIFNSCGRKWLDDEIKGDPTFPIDRLWEILLCMTDGSRNDDISGTPGSWYCQKRKNHKIGTTEDTQVNKICRNCGRDPREYHQKCVMCLNAFCETCLDILFMAESDDPRDQVQKKRMYSREPSHSNCFLCH